MPCLGATESTISTSLVPLPSTPPGCNLGVLLLHLPAETVSSCCPGYLEKQRAWSPTLRK